MCNKKYKKGFRGSFFTATDKSGIKDFYFCDLCHTFISHLVMGGADLNTVRELLGHKSLKMTLRYPYFLQKQKRRAVDILGRRMDIFWTPCVSVVKSEKIAELLTH
ncbi:MAG: tyrosine-type recombinase/integrase [Candidatus Omnitrophica bacterium]|nr:tyrosine-type recombinase/integrase [Candidatus Omnitrophota bacterium]